MREGVSLGVVQYVLKPFTFATLRDRLVRYAEFRAAAGEASGQDEVDRALAALRAPGPGGAAQGAERPDAGAGHPCAAGRADEGLTAAGAGRGGRASRGSPPAAIWSTWWTRGGRCAARSTGRSGGRSCSTGGGLHPLSERRDATGQVAPTRGPSRQRACSGRPNDPAGLAAACDLTLWHRTRSNGRNRPTAPAVPANHSMPDCTRIDLTRPLAPTFTGQPPGHNDVGQRRSCPCAPPPHCPRSPPLTALAAGTLTACGGGSGSDPDTVKVSYNQSTDNKIRFMDTYLEASRSSSRRTNPGKKVKLVPIQAPDNDYYTKLAADDALPEDRPGPGLRGHLPHQLRHHQAGYLKPLDDYLAKWDQTGASSSTRRRPRPRREDGKTYGIPDGTDTRGLWFNKDDLREGRAARRLAAEELGRRPRRGPHRSSRRSPASSR